MEKNASSKEIDKLIEKIMEDNRDFRKSTLNKVLTSQFKTTSKSSLGTKIMRRTKLYFEHRKPIEVKLLKTNEDNRELRDALKKANETKNDIVLLKDSQILTKRRIEEFETNLMETLKVAKCQEENLPGWRRSYDIRDSFEEPSARRKVIVTPPKCEKCAQYSVCLEEFRIRQKRKSAGNKP